MRKFSNFCGIFATVFVTTTIVLLASCSQDDDYYESDMYTLAEMETRGGGGDPGGNDPNPPTPYFGNPVKAGADTINFNVEPDCPMDAYINWTRGYTGLSSPVSAISVLISFYPILWEDNDTCRAIYYIISSTGEWSGPNNDMKIKIRYSKDSIVHKYGKDTTYIFNREYKYDYHADCISDSTLHPL